jgi:hypothetical protein
MFSGLPALAAATAAATVSTASATTAGTTTAAATVVATATTIAAATAEAAATTTAATAFRTRPRLIHIHAATIQLRTIQLRNCRLRFIGVCHFHETKAARLPGLLIRNDAHTFHRPVLRKRLLQLFLRRLETSNSRQRCSSFGTSSQFVRCVSVGQD